MTDEETIDLIGRYGSERSQEAAGAVFRRYFARLRGFLRPKLEDRLARRADADDVAQSVFNSFFRGVREGDFHFERREDVWHLLVRIALHKLHNQRRRHRAHGRDVAREASGFSDGIPAREPTPEEAAAVADELEACLRLRTARDRQILTLFLRGAAYENVAADVGWSQRTVRRVCEQFQADLRKRFAPERRRPEGGGS